MTRALALLVLALALALSLSPGCELPPSVAQDQGAPAEAAPGQGLLVIDHVTVVDATSARVDRAVRIAGGQILSVEDAGQSWPAGAQVVDGRGRYLIPGLVDPHVHLTLSGAAWYVGESLEQNLRATLYHGVTAVMDVGSPPGLLALKRISRERLLAPTLLLSGPFLTAAGSHPCESYPYDDCVFVTAATAAAEGERLLGAGADLLKVALADTSFMPWPATRLDPAALGALTALGARVLVHINSSRDVVDAVGHGARLLAHPPYDAPISEAALQAARQVTFVQTTVNAFASAPELVDGEVDLSDPGLLMGWADLDTWTSVRGDPGLLVDGWLEATRAWSQTARANLTTLRKAGVTLLPASDAGYLFTPHGLGLHRELRRLARDGWSPGELLRATTLTAREVLGLPGGTVAAGQPAELVLLTADPLARVENLDAVEAVVLRGQLLAREALRTVPLLTGRSVEGESCLDHDQCSEGLSCDQLGTFCRRGCPQPYDPVNPCGRGAWCMPSDAQVGTAIGVCRPDDGCALYQGQCGPAAYQTTCIPQDADTNGCWTAGDRPEGESCEFTPGGSTCAPKLYCSPLTYRCYRLCDPLRAAPGCTGSRTCELQLAGGLPWFGLCL